MPAITSCSLPASTPRPESAAADQGSHTPQLLHQARTRQHQQLCPIRLVTLLQQHHHEHPLTSLDTCVPPLAHAFEVTPVPTGVSEGNDEARRGDLPARKTANSDGDPPTAPSST